MFTPTGRSILLHRIRRKYSTRHPQSKPPNVEFYDHNHLANELGQPIELESTPDSAEAQVALKTLFGDPTNEILGLLGSELQLPLPAKYQDAQRRAYQKLLTYMQFVNETALGSETKDQDESQQLLAGAWAF